MHGENNSVYQQQEMVSILSVFKKIDHFFKSSTLAKTDVIIKVAIYKTHALGSLRVLRESLSL